MKKIKLLLLLLTVTGATFYSCSDNNPVENHVVTTKSISLRTTLNEIKKVNNINGKTTPTAQDQSFCFNFVFPLTLSYNNGTQITVASNAGLLEVLTSENSNLYIEGIAFPFQVQEENVITTINNEAEFYALIDACTSFYTVNDIVFDFTCYSIVFPISVINASGETVTVNNQTELVQMVSTPTGTSTYQLNIVFPISVVQNNQTIVINDLYDFFNLNNDCAAASCICNEVYSPVCVQTTNGIVEFSNACHAECAGYTANNFVDCNSTSPCNCSTEVNPVCVQTTTGIVQFDNACLAQCQGFTQADFVSCGGNPSQTFGQLLGTCFTFVYPVQVESQGALVTVNNDGELLQYWFPNLAAYPAIHYPATVTFINLNVSATVNNQAGLETLINQHCN